MRGQPLRAIRQVRNFYAKIIPAQRAVMNGRGAGADAQHTGTMMSEWRSHDSHT